MNEKIELVIMSLLSVFEMVVIAEMNQETEKFIQGRWIERRDLPFFMVGVQQLQLIDHFEENKRVYSVAARTRTVKYPIDIFDVVVNKDIIAIKVAGVEVSICAPAVNLQYYIPGEQLESLLLLSITSNPDLMETIKTHKGGPSEIKSTGK